MAEEKAHLPYFIDEPIYLLREDSPADRQEVEVKEATPLAESVEQDAPVPPVELNPIVTFGENLKHCIVLFSAEGKISADSKDLLFNILGAINRTPKDALMANVYGCSQEQLAALLAEHNHRHLISFGVSTIEPLLEAELYTPLVQKGKHYILSEGLEAVATETDKKRALWKALQEVFIKEQ